MSGSPPDRTRALPVGEARASAIVAQCPPIHTRPSAACSHSTRPSAPRPPALRGAVATPRQPAREQMQRDAGVEAAGHRIFDHRPVLVGEERPQLPIRSAEGDRPTGERRCRCRAPPSAAARRRVRRRPRQAAAITTWGRWRHEPPRRSRFGDPGDPRRFGPLHVAQRSAARQRRGAREGDAVRRRVSLRRGPRRIPARPTRPAWACRPPRARRGTCRASGVRRTASSPPG